MSIEREPQDPNAQAPAPAHRSYVGPADRYDLVSAMQFNLLTALGLREHHRLLDIGCGSLRGGRLFVVYLLPGCYHGIEPEPWLLRDGIAHELGEDLVRLKQPRFDHNRAFALGVFGVRFDYLLAQSVFSHASAGQIRTCLGEARRVMHPESLFAATFVKGAESYTGKDWVYPAPVTYRPEELEAMARDEGLRLTVIDWPHPNGQSWGVFHFPGRQVPERLSSGDTPAQRALRRLLVGMRSF